MKAGLEHSIPMSQQVIALLEAQKGKRKPGTEPMFPSRTKDPLNESSLVKAAWYKCCGA
jgi:integrase